jgi:hypothetical protein
VYLIVQPWRNTLTRTDIISFGYSLCGASRPIIQRGKKASQGKKEISMSLIVLIIILLLLFGGGGGYYGYRTWGPGGGIGIVGVVLIILVLLYLFGGLRLPR